MQVDPAGIVDGLESLEAGGTPARMLILDDGWQSVAQACNLPVISP